MNSKDSLNSFRQTVEEIVGTIPRGSVMTYGQLAVLAGRSRAARQVGGIAHYGDPSLPWHRVVNVRGGMASGYPGGRASQKQHLEAEGLKVSDDYYLDINRYIYTPENIGNSPLVVIVGETATGKTKLAISLAAKLNGEIICADSWTVRKGVNIGTDKPDSKQKAKIRHHLLDIVEPCSDFTVAVFKRMANQAIKDIHSRGKLPIMVGGSGLYIDSVIYDYSFLGAGDRSLRKTMNEMTLDELQEEIAKRGLDLPIGVDIQNKRRLIRVIESGGQLPRKSGLRSSTVIIGLKQSSGELKQSIENRVDEMIGKGLEKEVKLLSQKYGWDCEALKGVGYKQWREYFEGRKSLEETRQQIISATNNLAKKQRTWFKRNKSIHWYCQPVKTRVIVDRITSELAI